MSVSTPTAAERTLVDRPPATTPSRAAQSLGRRAIRVLTHELVREVVVPFVATRLLLHAIGLTALTLLPLGSWPGAWTGFSRLWLDVWSRWDGRWYLSVAADGYWYMPGYESNVAFAPLYPLLMRAAGFLFGQNDPEGWVLGGLVVSNLALLAACFTLRALARLDFSPCTAARAVLYLLVFPSSLFLSAVYADALFLALSLGAVYAARRDRWWLAGVLGGLATLSRPHGFLVLVPLVVEWVVQRRAAQRPYVHPRLLWLGSIPLAFFAWAAYLADRFGNPLVFAAAQAGWRRSLAPPWELPLRLAEVPVQVHGTAYTGWDGSLVDLGFTAVFVVAAVLAFRHLRPSYALYAAAITLTILSNSTLAAAPRYGLAIFPLFLLLALAGKHPGFHQTYLVLASSVGALFMALFALGYWVA